MCPSNALGWYTAVWLLVNVCTYACLRHSALRYHLVPLTCPYQSSSILGETFATHVIMPLRLTLIRQASKKLVAKLKPKWLGKGMRSISRGISRIPLNPVVAAVQAIGNVGSSVPFLQGVSSIVATILQRTEVSTRAA